MKPAKNAFFVPIFAMLFGCGGGGDGGGSSVAATHIISIVRTPAQLKWADADAYCKNTTFSNQTGWRLPTQPELTTYGKTGLDIADGKGGGAAWSSTPAQPTYHYYVSMNGTNGTAVAGEDNSFFYVRCAHD